MAKHRAGDRRIISISIPEQLAKKLDRKVGKGRKGGRSATIAKLIEQGLSQPGSAPAPAPANATQPRAPKGDVRVESDTMGELEVPGDRYFGCQTARSLLNFDIGHDTMPTGVIRAFGVLKQAAAKTNVALKQLDPEVGDLIIAASQEVLEGRLNDHFPLRVADRKRDSIQHEHKRSHRQPRH